MGLPTTLTLLITSLAWTAAWADRDEHARAPLQGPPAALALWKQECAGCHILFPPGMLPADSWRAMMGKLKDHFDSDASLSSAEAKAITEFLAANASRRPASKSAPLRITQTAWFRHEHDEIRAQVWKRPGVKTPANCQACHLQAEQGDFSERRIRIPR